jgi:deoxyribodipyrimidine photolyase
LKKIIVWFRKDLRLHDNPALWEAAQQGVIIPVFIWSEEEESENTTSAAGKWWLHHSLIALKKRLEAHRTPHGTRPLGTEISVYQDFFSFIDIYKKMTLVKVHPFLLFYREGDFISPTSYIVQSINVNSIQFYS